MFKKILIANRGEIALRIIRTCKEMGIKTVAVYSTVDQKSLHVKFADEAICIGAAPSILSYLNIPQIIAAAEITNADAIHPGYGFLSENPKFAKICQDYHIKLIGPSHHIIQTMGDKATAKKTMQAAGVPIIPGSKGIISSLDEGKSIAQNIQFPVILKATAGGGGKGMRIVQEAKDFGQAWKAATREAQAAFGNPGIYIEKYIEDPRHIEIQILADQHGHVKHLGERDCSIQRRHQKLIEETPSPFIHQALRKKMGDCAIKGAQHIGYEGAGTIEFLVDKHQNFYFMEMNTRIQVEHTITEEVTHQDLIQEQMLIAFGESIQQKQYVTSPLHAIECRINAEDPYHQFRPCPGKIIHFHAPGGYGVRLDTHIYPGYIIPPNYDSMIAKLIVKEKTRYGAIRKMKQALEEMIIEGVQTTIPFHIQMMDNKKFIQGDFTTHFLEKNTIL